MRKLDWLRKTVNAVKNEEEIYFIKLPSEFRNHGDYKGEKPCCIPIDDAIGVCGVSVMHTYGIKDQYGNTNLFQDAENFYFRKVVPFED